MPKCPNCPQFTSKDTDNEPDASLDVDGDGRVTGDVRIVNCCPECGDELEEMTFSIDEDFGDDVQDHETPEGKACEKPELDVNADASRTARTQTKDRHGKPIKNFRYQRRYYGVELDITVTCACGASWSRIASDETMASGMESLV